MHKFDKKTTDRLFNAILSLKTVDECYNFFEDLCTIKEVRDMAQRLEVAEMLNAKTGYQEISDKTSVSTATISRVSKCLNYGTGGYMTVINRIKDK